MSKTFKYLIASLVAVILAVLAALPSFLSTSWGKEILINKLDQKTAGTWKIETLSLSWFGPQKASKIEYTQNQKILFFTCDSLQTTSSLWTLLFYEKKLKKAFASSLFPLPFSGVLDVEKANLSICQEKQTPILFQDVSAKITLSEDRDTLSSTFSGKTVQEEILGECAISAIIHYPSLDLKTEIRNFPVKGLDQLISTISPQFSGMLVEALGPSLNVSAVIKTTQNDFDVQLKTSSPQLAIAVQTGSKNGIVSLTAPADLSYVFTPSFAQKLLNLFPALSHLRLKNAADLKLNIQNFSLPLEVPIDPARCSLNASLDLSKMDFEETESGLSFLVNNLSGNLQAEQLDKKADWNVNAALTSGSIHSTLDLKGQTLQGQTHFTARADNLSLVALDRILGPLPLVLGDTANLEIEGAKNGKEIPFSLSLLTPRLKIEGTHMLWDSALSKLEGELKVKEMTLNLQSFFKENGLTISAAIKQKEQLLGNFYLSLSSSQLVGKLDIANFSFVDPVSKRKSSIRRLNASLNRLQANSSLNIKVEGTAVSQGKEGSIKMEGTIDPTTLSTELKANIKDFPTLLFDIGSHCFENDPCPISSLFGPSLDATLSAQIADSSGPFSVVVNSPNTRLSMSGRVDKGMLTLSEPLHLQAALTKELTHFFLQEANPLSISSISTSHPITLEIDNQGFSCPLFPFNVQQLFIPQLRLELGQVLCHNEGNLNVTLGLLKLGQLGKERDLKLWFTPIDAQVKKGILSLERTEILVADTYEIALWGDINFPKDDVDMVLGLTAQCLKKSFNIKSLPENYVLQLPMTGKTSDVKIDTSKATAKIALLLAWQQKNLVGGIAGGPAGALFGEFLGALAGLPDKDSKAPPAKRPFPWDSETPPRKKKTKAIKKDDKPLKQLRKIFS